MAFGLAELIDAALITPYKTMICDSQLKLVKAIRLWKTAIDL